MGGFDARHQTCRRAVHLAVTRTGSQRCDPWRCHLEEAADGPQSLARRCHSLHALAFLRRTARDVGKRLGALGRSLATSTTPTRGGQRCPYRARVQQNALVAAADSYPGMPVRLEAEGQFNVAVRVGEDVLLRFPRHAFGAGQLAFEVRLLERVRRHLQMAVPEGVEVALDEPIGRAYVAHRYLPGTVVRSEDVAAWPAARVQQVGAEVGVFLRELHALASVGREAGGAQLTARAFGKSLAEEFDELLADRTNDLGRTRARREAATVAALPDHPAVLCHGDLGGNIVFDDRTESVGVIDFAGCVVTHPAFDLASLSTLGDGIVAACITTHPDLGRAMDHAKAVRETFALQDALNGARQEDWAYVDEILSGYTRANARSGRGVLPCKRTRTLVLAGVAAVGTMGTPPCRYACVVGDNASVLARGRRRHREWRPCRPIIQDGRARACNPSGNGVASVCQ